MTIVALAAMVPRALEAAERLAADHGIDAEVIDLRTLVPLDVDAILGSVAKTSRLFTVEENPRLCGWGAEIVSLVADEGFYEPRRAARPDHHAAHPAAVGAALEDLAMPTVDRIVDDGPAPPRRRRGDDAVAHRRASSATGRMGSAMARALARSRPRPRPLEPDRRAAPRRWRTSSARRVAAPPAEVAAARRRRAHDARRRRRRSTPSTAAPDGLLAGAHAGTRPAST